MVLSKRERYIGIVTVAVLAILVLDQFILSPALERIETLDADIELASEEMRGAQALFQASMKANREWSAIAGDALSRAGSGAGGGDQESRVLNAVREWAQEEGMRLPSVIPQPMQQEQGFNKSVLRATGSGSLSQIGRFLYRLQTTSMPVRITDMQLGATKDGTDELSLNVGIATISPSPDASQPGGAGGGAGGASPAPAGRDSQL